MWPCHLYADDAVIYFVGEYLTTIENVTNADLFNQSQWFAIKLTLNDLKTKCVIFSSPYKTLISHTQLLLYGYPLPQVDK